MRRFHLAAVLSVLGMGVLIGCEQGLSPDEPGTGNVRLALGGPGGQNIVANGVGMASGSGSFSLNVPVTSQSDILVAAFYYNGFGPDPDDTVVINGEEYTASVIPGVGVHYKLLATDLTEGDGSPLIEPGDNTFSVEGIDFGPEGQVNGIGLAVVYRDPSVGAQQVLLLDIADFFWWPDAEHPNSQVHSFTFDPAAEARDTRFLLFVGECQEARSDRVWWDSDEGSVPPGELVGGPYDSADNELVGAQGPQWDVFVKETTIPADAGYFAFQIESPEEGNGDSGLLTFAALVVPGECTGAIGNFVWHDENANGLQDEDEPGIPGVTVTLLDADQTLIGMTTTDEDGFYAFTELCAGIYFVDVVDETVPEGWTPTECEVGDDPEVDSNCAPAEVVLENDGDRDDTIDFGYVAPCEGMIGDFVWFDENENGIQDEGEPGIEGVVVRLYDADQNMIDTTTTDGAGYYSFMGLCAGTYFVGAVTPDDHEPTECEVGDDRAVDSNCIPSEVVLETDDATDDTVDFGYVEVGDFTSCSHGYWKRHLDSWVDYSPAQTVVSVFEDADAYPEIASATLLEALEFGGGNGVEGGARILLKQAVGALLNATHGGLTYPLSVDEVIDETNEALASGDRDTMIDLGEYYDDLANDYPCPLN